MNKKNTASVSEKGAVFPHARLRLNQKGAFCCVQKKTKWGV